MLAIILSLLVPGLGNAYAGQVKFGIATFAGFIVSAAIAMSFSYNWNGGLLLFLLLTIFLWLMSMTVAYGTAVKINNGEYIHDMAFFPKKAVSKS